MELTIATVGELIEVLKKFDRNLPVLKSDACGVSYLPVDLLENLVFPVRRHTYPGGIDEYLDADPADKNFDAVVL
jgi:S-adenosylmethionine synthetase